MVKNIVKILGIILIALIQATILPKFALFEVIPNLILILALILILHGRIYESFLTVLLGGIFLDLGSDLKFGTISLILFLILVAIFFLSRKVPLNNNFLFIGFTFLGGIMAFNLLLSFLLKFFGGWILIDTGINFLWGMLLFILSMNLFKNEKLKLT